MVCQIKEKRFFSMCRFLYESYSLIGQSVCKIFSLFTFLQPYMTHPLIITIRIVIGIRCSGSSSSHIHIKTS